LDGSPEPFGRCERGSLDAWSDESCSGGMEAFDKAFCMTAADGDEVGRFGCRCGLPSLFLRERIPLDGFDVGAVEGGPNGAAGDESRDECGELRLLCEALMTRGALERVGGRAN
jgi:hypothetical protein